MGSGGGGGEIMNLPAGRQVSNIEYRITPARTERYVRAGITNIEVGGRGRMFDIEMVLGY
jgi:hypothetical protein